MMKLCIAFVAAGLLMGGSCRAANDVTLESMFGTYVGYAELIDPDGAVERRETDTILEPYETGGVRIRWINVTLKDGRRDWPGVVRRVSEVGFVPAERGEFFVRGGDYNPFRTKEAFQPYHGNPVQWAFVDTLGLHVYSFVIHEDGRFELQRYSREPDAGELQLEFQRIDDGDVKRQIHGRAVRAVSRTGD